MDFSILRTTDEFRRELREVLYSPAVDDLVNAVATRADGMDGDARELYRHLGKHGVLAPAWPSEYGGRDGDFTETLVLMEELVQRGVPQSLYFISVQIVGSLILQSGTEEQKRTLLPRLASGDLAACILFTEPDNGSDLAGVVTRAERNDRTGAWTVSGRKKFNLKTAYADVALIAARTDDSVSPYEGISLFLAPLSSPGVTVRPLPSLADEQFHDVSLDGVRVGDDALLGAPGEGWSLITGMFSAERSGVDYYARGLHWLRLAEEQLTAGGRRAGEDEASGLARHWARLDAGRLLSGRALQRLQEREPDIAEASLAKWHNSDTAQQIAWWSLERLGLPVAAGGPQASSTEVLEAAYREAAGMTISGGASEVLLEIVAGARLHHESDHDHAHAGRRQR
ncbi:MULTISPECIES: acyl-CoA dehydrogenase family protein [unclassified Streptomyces]|uniref:acyl-CoA dehydrogenase family protein n=1 Tax=unclassified Streptomyces TaxID=2593676 RepID=UPI0006AE4249|nr:MULTISPECIES: acyl-CoA dehydrogenase family protein [unclassified Streptomyces]KOX23571.1 hypothetical protein ADL06_22075 [Streptomyces sp. NRRL F-6491]KOX40365.1 hypothetical protein ADL08_22470 [Streptomyces sp. NRRL F-6492]